MSKGGGSLNCPPCFPCAKEICSSAELNGFLVLPARYFVEELSRPLNALFRHVTIPASEPYIPDAVRAAAAAETGLSPDDFGPLAPRALSSRGVTDKQAQSAAAHGRLTPRESLRVPNHAPSRPKARPTNGRI